MISEQKINFQQVIVAVLFFATTFYYFDRFIKSILAPGVGFVFAAVHNIQSEVLPRNILAMCETIKRFG